MPLDLYSEEFGSEENPPLICLHGLLGSSRNWRSVAKELSSSFHVFCLDLRNHGKSFHHGDGSIQAMTSDVLHWMEQKKIKQSIICGHSLGGKIAMKLACCEPDMVESLIIVDIAPRDYPPDHHIPTLDALLALDLESITDRKLADSQLREKIPNWAFRQFLLTNLKVDGGKLSWQANLNTLRNEITHLSANPLSSEDRFSKPTLLVRGGLSGYVRTEHIGLFEQYFSQFMIETVEDAGHDVHVENRAVFVSLVKSFLLAERSF